MGELVQRVAETVQGSAGDARRVVLMNVNPRTPGLTLTLQVVFDSGRPPRMSAPRVSGRNVVMAAPRRNRSESPAAELHKWWVTVAKVQFGKTLECEKVIFRWVRSWRE